MNLPVKMSVHSVAVKKWAEAHGNLLEMGCRVGGDSAPRPVSPICQRLREQCGGGGDRYWRVRNLTAELSRVLVVLVSTLV